MERARAEDPRLQALKAVLHHWETAVGLRAVTVQELIEAAIDYPLPAGGIDLNKRQFLHPEFRESLLVVAGEGGTINSRRLGKWLGSNKGKVAGCLGRQLPAGLLRMAYGVGDTRGPVNRPHRHPPFGFQVSPVRATQPGGQRAVLDSWYPSSRISFGTRSPALAVPRSFLVY
jgi:hypothetical protein